MISLETLTKLSKIRKIRLSVDESKGLSGSEWTFLDCETIETPRDYPIGTYKIIIPAGIEGESQIEDQIGRKEAEKYLGGDFSSKLEDEEIQAMLTASQQGPKNAEGYYLGAPDIPHIEGKVSRPVSYFKRT